MSSSTATIAGNASPAALAASRQIVAMTRWPRYGFTRGKSRASALGETRSRFFVAFPSQCRPSASTLPLSDYVQIYNHRDIQQREVQ